MKLTNTKTALNEIPAFIVAPTESCIAPTEQPSLDLQIVRETRDGVFGALNDWLNANAPADVIDALRHFSFLSHVASEADANNGRVSPDTNSALAIEVWQAMKLTERLTRGAK